MNIWTYARIEEYIEECLWINMYRIIELNDSIILQIDMPANIHIDKELLEHLRYVYNKLGWQHVVLMTIYKTELQKTVDSVHLMTEKYNNGDI